jgi:predicted dithiol-disulfide oxidoreductase (DUF899 family)
MNSDTDVLKNHRVVSQEEWLAHRIALLAEEKAFTRQREELAIRRRALPWVKVEKPYRFEASDGTRTLPELFEGRRQLIVYHFMFNPEAEAGCAHCSFWADHYDGAEIHLKQRDVSLVAVSRAPIAKIDAFKRRMGWKFNWLSSGGGDFNFDYQASFREADLRTGKVFYNYTEAPALGPDREGISVFYRENGNAIYHTYSCYARGIDMVNGTYQFLDLVPKGRDENPASTQSWVRHHDHY